MTIKCFTGGCLSASTKSTSKHEKYEEIGIHAEICLNYYMYLGFFDLWTSQRAFRTWIKNIVSYYFTVKFGLYLHSNFSVRLVLNYNILIQIKYKDDNKVYDRNKNIIIVHIQIHYVLLIWAPQTLKNII